MTSGRRTRALLLFSLLIASPAAYAAVDPTYAALRDARLAAAAHPVTGLVLKRGDFTLRLQSGSLSLLEPVAGRAFGAVFTGAGSWELLPTRPEEKQHLEILLGQPLADGVLRDTFDHMVLLFSDATAAAIEAHSPKGAADPKAAGFYEAFMRQQKKDWRTNFQLRALVDATAPPQTKGFFLAFVDGAALPKAVLAYDPTGFESTRLVGDANYGGAETAMVFADKQLGGIAYLGAPSAASIHNPGSAFVADGYVIDTTIDRKATLAGITEIRLRAVVGRQRIVPLTLSGLLRVSRAQSAATDGSWSDVTFIQEGADEDPDLAVVLAATPVAGAAVRLRLTYQGAGVVQKGGDGNFYVEARSSWYPNLGTFGEPTPFELTFRHPKDLQVVTISQPERDAVDGEVRVASFKRTTARVAGFNYGKFRKLSQADPDSGLTIDVFTNANDAGVVDQKRLAESALVDGVNAARLCSVYFGRLDIAHIAITQQSQWDFGQSWPALIYLPYLAFLDGGERNQFGLRGVVDFIDNAGHHEFAHQWFAHRVGVASDADLWLSEGFAEHAASLVVEHAQGTAAAARYWQRSRDNILAKPTAAKLANNEGGPISMGSRLGTSRAPGAYGAMVYDKGAFVLHMLRMMMRDPRAANPDATFIAAMTDYVTAQAGKSPSTRDFQAVIEKHMVPALNATGDGKLDWFFDQWVRGTEIPRYVSNLKAEKVADKQFRITGIIVQQGVSAGFLALVPLYADMGSGRLMRIGVLPMKGTTEVPVDLTIGLAKKPDKLLLNAMYEVLARP